MSYSPTSYKRFCLKSSLIDGDQCVHSIPSYNMYYFSWNMTYCIPSQHFNCSSSVYIIISFLQVHTKIIVYNGFWVIIVLSCNFNLIIIMAVLVPLSLQKPCISGWHSILIVIWRLIMEEIAFYVVSKSTIPGSPFGISTNIPSAKAVPMKANINYFY